jgi:hypothetical protein
VSERISRIREIEHDELPTPSYSIRDIGEQNQYMLVKFEGRICDANPYYILVPFGETQRVWYLEKSSDVSGGGIIGDLTQKSHAVFAS